MINHLSLVCASIAFGMGLGIDRRMRYVSIILMINCIYAPRKKPFINAPRK